MKMNLQISSNKTPVMIAAYIKQGFVRNPFFRHSSFESAV